MKPKRFLRQKTALFSIVVGCGTAVPAWSQNMFDVFFLTDTTGSMGGLIGGVQASSTAIFDAFITGRDVRFGVGEYKDGNSDAFGFRYNLVEDGLPTLSSDRSSVIAAINQWTASGGGDFPEDNLLGLREAASGVPWRDGSRKIIYWFGDAPGLDPASDGTTLADTLAVLSANCIEVIAIDLGSLDSTGQATAITSATLVCGKDGGEIIELDLFGLSAEEAADLILRTLAESFDDITGGGNANLIVSGNISASITLGRTMTRDVGSRLFRMRSGVMTDMTGYTAPPPPVPGPKGGMSKAGPMAPQSFSYSPKWEVWGQIYYSEDSHDAQRRVVGTANRLVHSRTRTDIFGGTIGVEYQPQPLTFGLAVSAAEADVSISGIGTTDIDSVALIPYISYYRPDVFRGADFYADALYAYSWNDYKTDVGGASASTDGHSHQLELNAGLNFRTERVVHGPFAQFRWLDGEIDRYAAFPDTDYESVASQLGYQASFPIRINGGTVVPQVTAAWEHEFEPSQGSIGPIPLGELDDDLAVLGAGVGVFFDNGWNGVLSYEARLGSKNDNHYVGLKVGKEF